MRSERRRRPRARCPRPARRARSGRRPFIFGGPQTEREVDGEDRRAAAPLQPASNALRILATVSCIRRIERRDLCHAVGALVGRVSADADDRDDRHDDERQTAEGDEPSRHPPRISRSLLPSHSLSVWLPLDMRCCSRDVTENAQRRTQRRYRGDVPFVAVTDCEVARVLSHQAEGHRRVRAVSAS